MQIVHRISFNSSAEIRKELLRLGHVVPDRGFVALDVDEADGNWPAIERWVAERRAVDIVSTRFAPSEIAAASWLELCPSWHQGYPQPQNGFAFRAITYDLGAFCKTCGIGAEQRAPFRMRKEPKWGRREILQLNWVFDEFFVTPSLWRSLFEPLDVAARPVVDCKGRTLQTVVQLAIVEVVEINRESLQPMACEDCRRVKYLPHTLGPFPALTGVPRNHIARTAEQFGSGPSAARRVVVSAAVARALSSRGVRGAEFRPVAEMSAGV